MDYKRDSKRVYKAINRVGNKIIALEELRMMFPTRWLERDLAEISTNISVIGYVALITKDNKYAVSKVAAFFRTEPDKMSNEIVNDEKYTVFHYEKGSQVVCSTDMVVIDSLVHPIYTEFLGSGKIPWYYSYDDLHNLFEGIQYYNEVDKGGDIAIWSFMAATASRDPDNLQEYFRRSKKIEESKPTIIGLKQVHFHGGNVLAKLGGSYYDAGTTSALVNPSTRIERAETMLTKV